MELISLADLSEIVGVANKSISTIAIGIGGFWAYVRFVHGRTFKYRMEINQVTQLSDSSGSSNLLITVSIKNSGLGRVPLNEKMKVIRILGTRALDAERVDLVRNWEQVTTVRFLDQHAWIEPGETVVDEALFALPGSRDDESFPFLAYKTEVIVGSKTNWFTNKGISWHARRIVIAPSKGVEGEQRVVATARKGRGHKDLEQTGSGPGRKTPA